MGQNNLLGAWGEATAASYLQKKRYKLEAAGFHCRYGEVDLVVCNRKYLVFVEVKLRKSQDFAQAKEFVDIHKQERLKTTAEYYLAKYPTNLRTRFDVIEIYAPEGMSTNSPVIHHLEDAF